jgi:alpha-glucuronidase
MLDDAFVGPVQGISLFLCKIKKKSFVIFFSKLNFDDPSKSTLTLLNAMYDNFTILS